MAASEDDEDTEEQITLQPPPRIENKSPATPTSTKKSKNKKKKRKPPKDETPSSREPTPAPTSLDEVDAAVHAISLKYGEQNPLTNPPTVPSTTRNALLSVHPKTLDANAELRKLFGKIVDAEARDAAKQSIHGVSPRMINRIKAMDRQRRNHVLMKPKDEWQLYAGYRNRMVSMDIVGRTPTGETEFKFVHSNKYSNIQMSFYAITMHGDPNLFMNWVRNYPFHVDSW
jgi:Transcriptional repressor TCF25